MHQCSDRELHKLSLINGVLDLFIDVVRGSEVLRGSFSPYARTSLTNGDARCGGEFRTTFRTIPRSREAGAKFQTSVLMG
jgi:hypothetical protein